jgi:single-stranded-DNA-specific exonuclease
MAHELENIADKSIDDMLLVKNYSADMELGLSQTTLSLAKMLTSLEPFGMNNQKPKFLLRDLVVLEDRKLGSEGKHRKLLVEKDGVTRDLLIFNADSTLPAGRQVSFVKAAICTLDVNVWRDKESLQLISSYVEI